MRPTFDSMGFTPEEAMDSLSEDVVEAGHEIDRLRAALAKAEAERDEFKAKAVDAIECAIRAEKDERADAYRHLAAMTEWTDASANMDYAIVSVYGNRTVNQESPEAKQVIEDARIRLRAAEAALRAIVEEARK